MFGDSSGFVGNGISRKSSGLVRNKVALVVPFLPQLPLCPTCFLGYGSAVLAEKYDLDVIDLNADLHFRNSHRLKPMLDTDPRALIVSDHLFIGEYCDQMDADIEDSYASIRWDRYARVYITSPSWCPMVPTEGILRLSRAIKQVSPGTAISYFGNSVGSWTNKAELHRNDVQAVHLNGLCEMDGTEKPVDYDSLPIPTYGNRYKYLFDIVPFMLKHGCPWGRCRFCSLSRGGNSGCVERSPKAVIEELEVLIDRYDPTALVCTDHSFNGDNLIEFCGYLERFNRPWGGWSRADLSSEKVDALAKAGCRWIFFGVESGSDGTLSAMSKGISSRQISDLIKAVHSNGILPAASFLVGTPGEDTEDFEKSLRFLEDHRNYLYAVNVFPFIATPGSEFLFEQKHPDKNTPIRVFQFIQACKDLGLKVFLGEQCMQYYLFNSLGTGVRARA